MQLTVDLLRTPDGRLEGIVITETGRELAFSGTLELLRVLEDLEGPLSAGPAGPPSESR